MAKNYFEGINYGLGNEDTSLEEFICAQNKSQLSVAVCGSGGRALPLAPHSKKLILVDLSREQLALARLRQSAYLELDHQDFLRFFGYAPYGPFDYSHERKKILKELHLDKATHDFFQNVFSEIDYGPVIYSGKWERTFHTLSKIMQKIMGKDYDRILHFHSIEEQKEYYESDFPKLKWNLVMFLLGNHSVFNALLYKGNFVKKNVSETYLEYYRAAFDRLFSTMLARESFFLHLCFYGKIMHEDGNPMEAKKDIFDKIQSCLKQQACQIDHHHGDIFGLGDFILQNHAGQKINFLSLSDVPSYFHGDLEKSFLQRLQPLLADKAIVVVRYYLRVLTPDCYGFSDITIQYRDLIAQEKVQMYRIKIYQKMEA